MTQGDIFGIVAGCAMTAYLGGSIIRRHVGQCDGGANIRGRQSARAMGSRSRPSSYAHRSDQNLASSQFRLARSMACAGLRCQRSWPSGLAKGAERFCGVLLQSCRADGVRGRSDSRAISGTDRVIETGTHGCLPQCFTEVGVSATGLFVRELFH